MNYSKYASHEKKYVSEDPGSPIKFYWKQIYKSKKFIRWLLKILNILIWMYN